jgi:hypothetical protein
MRVIDDLLPKNTIADVEQRRPLRRQLNDHNFVSLLMLAVAGAFLLVTWVATKGVFFFLKESPNPLKATLEEFSRPYDAASPDEQAALGVWMRKIILPGKIRRDDLARARRSEKDRITARDRRIMEFPSSISPNAVAKALRAEGWYSAKTTVYHIEYRVRRLRKN